MILHYRLLLLVATGVQGSRIFAYYCGPPNKSCFTILPNIRVRVRMRYVGWLAAYYHDYPPAPPPPYASGIRLIFPYKFFQWWGTQKKVRTTTSAAGTKYYY